MRDSRKKRGNGADSLQELLKNTKFEGTDKDFMGDGISPDKKRRSQKHHEDKETQQNKEKTRRIL